MTEFREKALSQSIVSRRGGAKAYTVPDPEGGRAKVVRDENGNDTITRNDGRVDVTINVSEPVSAKSGVEY